MSNYASIQFSASGEPVEPAQSTTINPADVPGITWRDTANLKASLDPERDPERALHQAEVDELASRTFKAEAFALELVNKQTGKPFVGAESDFARRMAIASELREQGQYALTVGNNMIKARGGNAPYDPVIADLRAQLLAQDEAREAARLAKIAARSR